MVAHVLVVAVVSEQSDSQQHFSRTEFPAALRYRRSLSANNQILMTSPV